MNRIKDFFTKNLGLKSLSLFLALVLWFVGMNINNPTLIQTFTVNLELRNVDTLEENGLIILNEDELRSQKIDLRVRGSRIDLLELQRNYQNNLKAYIDFAPLDISSAKNIGKKFYMTVYKPDVTSNYEVLDNYPKSVEVVLDKIIVEEKPIEVETEGTTKEGYVIAGDPIVDPTSVTFEGASTLIDDIKRVVVYLDVEGKTASVTETLPIKIISNNDEDITGDFTIDHTEAQVTVNIIMQKKIPLVKPAIVGEPGENYKLKNVTYSTDHIEVVGDEAAIDAIADIALEPIDITGKTEDFVVTQDLNRLLSQVDPSLSIRNGTPTIINIEFDLEEIIEKELLVPIENISIKGQKEGMVVEEFCSVVVSGYKTDVDAISEEDIEGSVDLRNAVEGENQIEVSITVPDTVELVNQPILNVSLEGEVTTE